MELAFRPLAPADLALTSSWMPGWELRADRWRDQDTRSVLALGDGIPLGAGVMWTSRVHADGRYFFAVGVEPSARRRGVGTAIFTHLSGLRARDVAFMTRGFNGSVELAFAESLGARTIQMVPPAKVATASSSELRPWFPDQLPAFKLVSGADLGFAAVAAAEARIYEWQHASWNPVGPRFQEARVEDLDDVDLEATSVVTDNQGRAAAVVCVFGHGDNFLLTGETTSRDQTHGERLLEAALHRSLSLLATRGVTQVEGDLHVSDPHMMPVWTRLNPTGSWFRLVEVPPAS